LERRKGLEAEPTEVTGRHDPSPTMDGREDTNIRCGVKGSPQIGNQVRVD
jgi:hypothetical protein